MNVSLVDDNTFYMSFDDFCNVFRNLYVCRYYQPGRWMEQLLPGLWKKSDVKEFEKNELMKQFMDGESGGGDHSIEVGHADFNGFIVCLVFSVFYINITV